jgi:hypothetical protein
MQLKNLADNAVLVLPDDLLWADEHAWTPAVAAVSYLLTGALLVESAARQAGRPITLVGAADMAWVTRATVDTLCDWAAEPNRQFEPCLSGFHRRTLVLRFINTFTIRPSLYQRLSIQTGPDLRSSLRFP